MNQQEREIISDIFKRLEQSGSQPRDPETERFIAERIRQQPYAPYAMAQLVYVQEQALTSLNQQVQQMRNELEQARSQPQSGGFLSSLFGGGNQARQPEPPRPAGGPWGQAQQPGYGQPGYGQPGYPQQGGYPPPGYGQPQGGFGGGPFGGAAQPGGGGFLRSALTTAAGVAGGMVVGNALVNAFSGGGHGQQALAGMDPSALTSLPGGDAAAASGAFGDLSPFQDAGAGAGAGGFDPGGGGGGFQDASFDDGADFGDSGGGDDWA